MNQRIVSDITDFIFVADEPRGADAIFLPGSPYPEPPEYAARLYRGGFAPLLVPAGGVSVKTGRFGGVQSKAEVYDKDYRTECEFMTDVLMKNGVPASAILGEDRSGHTRDNAFLSRRAADARGLEIRSALIVCRPFHARRCLMLYQLAFPEAEICVCPAAAGDGVTRENWFASEAGVDRVFGELARCGNQFVGDVKRCLGV